LNKKGKWKSLKFFQGGDGSANTGGPTESRVQGKKNMGTLQGEKDSQKRGKSSLHMRMCTKRVVGKSASCNKRKGPMYLTGEKTREFCN